MILRGSTSPKWMFIEFAQQSHFPWTLIPFGQSRAQFLFSMKIYKKRSFFCGKSKAEIAFQGKKVGEQKIFLRRLISECPSAHNKHVFSLQICFMH